MLANIAEWDMMLIQLTKFCGTTYTKHYLIISITRVYLLHDHYEPLSGSLVGTFTHVIRG